MFFRSLALIAAMLNFSPVLAQRGPGDGDTHIPVPTDARNLTRWIDARKMAGVQNGLDSELIRKLMATLGKQDPEQLKKLADQFIDPKDFQDPDKLADLKKFIDGNPQLKDPKTLENLLKNFQNNGGNPLPKDPPFDPKKLNDIFKNLDKLPKDDQNPVPVDPLNPNPMPPKVDPLNPNPIPPKVDPLKPNPEEQPKTPEVPDERTEQLQKWVEENFGESEATQGMIKEFAEAFRNAGVNNEKALSFMPDMSKEMGEFSKWSMKQFNNSGINMPKFNGPNVNLPKFNGPNINAPTLPSTGGSWGSFKFSTTTFLIVLGILVLIVFLFWVVVNREGLLERARSGGVGSLVGLHAVGDVRSREDIIRAFETLSVNHCGHEAATWNHRIIAEELTIQNPEQQTAATNLAGLYEHARYAPLQEEMTATQLAQARESIRTIDGGS